LFSYVIRLKFHLTKLNLTTSSQPQISSFTDGAGGCGCGSTRDEIVGSTRCSAAAPDRGTVGSFTFNVLTFCNRHGNCLVRKEGETTAAAISPSCFEACAAMIIDLPRSPSPAPKKALRRLSLLSVPRDLQPKTVVAEEPVTPPPPPLLLLRRRRLGRPGQVLDLVVQTKF
jgi:hypothetical protein